MKIAAVRTFARCLPGVVEAPHFASASLRVDGKIFATIPPDSDYVHIFVNELDRDIALRQAPQFIEKLIWGGKVVGVKVALARAKPALVRALLAQAWVRKGGKKR